MSSPVHAHVRHAASLRAQTTMNCFPHTVVSVVGTVDYYQRMLYFDFEVLNFTRASDGAALDATGAQWRSSAKKPHFNAPQSRLWR